MKKLRAYIILVLIFASSFEAVANPCQKLVPAHSFKAQMNEVFNAQMAQDIVIHASPKIYHYVNEGMFLGFNGWDLVIGIYFKRRLLQLPLEQRIKLNKKIKEFDFESPYPLSMWDHALTYAAKVHAIEIMILKEVLGLNENGIFGIGKAWLHRKELEEMATLSEGAFFLLVPNQHLESDLEELDHKHDLSPKARALGKEVMKRAIEASTPAEYLSLSKE